MSEEAPDLYTLMLYEQVKGCSAQLKEQSDRFNAHTKAVSEFLSELYAIMVDPLADGVIPVAEMMAALKQAALRDREKWNDLDALDSAEKARLGGPTKFPG